MFSEIVGTLIADISAEARKQEEGTMTSNTGKIILWTLTLAAGLYGVSLVCKLLSTLNGLVS